MRSRLQIKLDARYKGYPQWEYCINRPERTSKFFQAGTRYESMQIFFQWRRWCWETWGPSKELSEWLDDATTPRTVIAPEDHNPHWCWLNDQFATRIYLRTDAELTLFLLRWA